MCISKELQHFVGRYCIHNNIGKQVVGTVMHDGGKLQGVVYGDISWKPTASSSFNDKLR